MNALHAALALFILLAGFSSCEPRPPKPKTYFFAENSQGGTALSSAHKPILRSRAYVSSS